MENFKNIPEELKALQQWVCFDLIDGKKIPFIPGSDNQAASNRSRDWRSFRAALADVESGKRQHLGFCFADSDPYTFIDLDDIEDPEQRQVFDRLQTYCQRSISGEGCHLICKGTFEGSGKHPAKPEAGIFKTNRFCLMTGDIVDGRDTINVVADADLQAIHSWLGGGREAHTPDLVEYQAEIPDLTVFEMGCDTFTKFEALCCGEWEQFEEYHGDHSTADHAFIAMLCDLTESNEQVRWFFGHSGMWNAERAEKKAGHGFDGYVNRTISKIRGNQAHMADMRSRITLCFEDEPEPLEEVAVVVSQTPMIDALPDGLIKDLALYSYRTSYYPLEAASVAVALTVVCALAGRAYLTPTKMGLNVWIILVGGSGSGKDEFQAGIGRIFGSLIKRGIKSPMDLFGGELASGEAIEQVFSTRKRYISFMTEFGKKFKQLTAFHAPPHIENLQRGLLNSYNSAGATGALRTRERAQRADTEIKVIERPCLVLAGETTPEPLYNAMTQDVIESGFIQRFTILNVAGKDWTLSPNANYGKAPSKALVDRLEELVFLTDTFDVENTAKKKDPHVVEIEPEADEIIRRIELEKREANRKGLGSVAGRELSNRTAMKLLRYSTAMAVSRDLYAPRITVEDVEWAVGFVGESDDFLANKFTKGEVGTGQTKQEAEVVKAARAIAKLTIGERRKLGMEKKVANEPMMLPLSVLKEFVVTSSVFSNDKLGSVTAFEKCVDSLIKSGTFTKLEVITARNDYDHMKGVLLCVH